MRPTRRRALLLGAGLVAAAAVPRRVLAGEAEVRMLGDATGSHVGFDPVGLWIEPGQTVRWTNADAGNSHTSTAYDPANFDRPRRIPAGAAPWDSDYLLPDESFAVTLTAEGVYDYYCVPHEHAGMVGRIVVGEPGGDGWMREPGADAGLPAAALAAFPSVEAIVANRIVRRTLG
jgi:plastocyanin